MADMRGKTFHDMALDITSKTVTDCVFDGCIVEWRKAPDTINVRNKFVNCELRGDGWPRDAFADKC